MSVNDHVGVWTSTQHFYIHAVKLMMRPVQIPVTPTADPGHMLVAPTSESQLVTQNNKSWDSRVKVKYRFFGKHMICSDVLDAKVSRCLVKTSFFCLTPPSAVRKEGMWGNLGLYWYSRASPVCQSPEERFHRAVRWAAVVGCCSAAWRPLRRKKQSCVRSVREALHRPKFTKSMNKDMWGFKYQQRLKILVFYFPEPRLVELIKINKETFCCSWTNRKLDNQAAQFSSCSWSSSTSLVGPIAFLSSSDVTSRVLRTEYLLLAFPVMPLSPSYRISS